MLDGNAGRRQGRDVRAEDGVGRLKKSPDFLIELHPMSPRWKRLIGRFLRPHNGLA
jgi:hypothetical protein